MKLNSGIGRFQQHFTSANFRQRFFISSRPSNLKAEMHLRHTEGWLLGVIRFWNSDFFSIYEPKPWISVDYLLQPLHKRSYSGLFDQFDVLTDYIRAFLFSKCLKPTRPSLKVLTLQINSLPQNGSSSLSSLTQLYQTWPPGGSSSFLSICKN